MTSCTQVTQAARMWHPNSPLQAAAGRRRPHHVSSANANADVQMSAPMCKCQRRCACDQCKRNSLNWAAPPVQRYLFSGGAFVFYVCLLVAGPSLSHRMSSLGAFRVEEPIEQVPLHNWCPLKKILLIPTVGRSLVCPNTLSTG